MKKRLLFAVIAFVLVVCTAAQLYRIQKIKRIGRAEDAAKAMRKAARDDSEEIGCGVEAYWADKNAVAKFENDEIRLKNDMLRVDIARLEGRPFSRAQIQKDSAMLEADRAAMKLNESAKSIELDSYQAEARIKEHNRRYPADQIADISDVNRELERFRARINAIAQGQE